MFSLSLGWPLFTGLTVHVMANFPFIIYKYSSQVFVKFKRREIVEEKINNTIYIAFFIPYIHSSEFPS